MRVELDWPQQLIQSATQRNPLLAKRLRPGLAKGDAEAALKAARATGDIGRIVALYNYKDGTDLTLYEPVHSKSVLDQLKREWSLFPGAPCYFVCLEMSIGQFKAWRQISKRFPSIVEAVHRYFPLFWNGSTEFLAIDLKLSTQNRMVLLNHRSVPAIQEAYGSFPEFVEDAVSANENNVPLRCEIQRSPVRDDWSKWKELLYKTGDRRDAF